MIKLKGIVHIRIINKKDRLSERYFSVPADIEVEGFSGGTCISVKLNEPINTQEEDIVYYGIEIKEGNNGRK